MTKKEQIAKALIAYRRAYFDGGPASEKFRQVKSKLEKLGVSIEKRNAALWRGNVHENPRDKWWNVYNYKDIVIGNLPVEGDLEDDGFPTTHSSVLALATAKSSFGPDVYVSYYANGTKLSVGSRAPGTGSLNENPTNWIYEHPILTTVIVLVGLSTIAAIVHPPSFR